MKNVTMNRRNFLKNTALALAGVNLSHAVFARELIANKKLIFINLQGAMDSLNVLAPHSEAHYYTSRPTIALKKQSLNPVNTLFGLHPNLPFVHHLYQKKQVSLFPATATSYRARSHFDAQKILENGTSTPKQVDGWINRLLQETNNTHKAIGVTQQMPHILRGSASTSSWYPVNRTSRGDFDELLDILYSDSPKLAALYEEAKVLHSNMQSMNTTRESKKSGGAFINTIKESTFLLNQHANILVYEISGWDTHHNQGAVNGRLARQLTKLDTLIRTLNTQLTAKQWDNTAIIITSEFGRTVEENGSNGTDHGTGGLTLLAGGAVNGGAIRSEWPGLHPDKLLDGRDLNPTLHLHAIVKSVLHHHLGVDQNTINRVLFDSTNISMLNQLTH